MTTSRRIVTEKVPALVLVATLETPIFYRGWNISVIAHTDYPILWSQFVAVWNYCFELVDGALNLLDVALNLTDGALNLSDGA